MKILVTGASGFSGGNVIRYLIGQGHDVTGLYWKHIPQHVEGCTLLQQNLAEEINISNHFDGIIHTACTAPGRNVDFLAFKQGNIDSMQQLIKFARKNSIKCIVNFSTKSIYGEIRVNEIVESSDRINQDMYGFTKYAAECILRDACDIDGFNLRVPGITGPGAHNTWLVFTVEQFIKGQPVVISDIMTKNFVWIFDIAAFAEQLIKQSSCGEHFKYNTVNLASSIAVSNVDIAKKIKQRINSQSVIESCRNVSGLGNLDISRAIEMGYRPHNPIQIVNWYIDSMISKNE